jgi:hypothetical protein
VTVRVACGGRLAGVVGVVLIVTEAHSMSDELFVGLLLVSTTSVRNQYVPEASVGMVKVRTRVAVEPLMISASCPIAGYSPRSAPLFPVPRLRIVALWRFPSASEYVPVMVTTSPGRGFEGVTVRVACGGRSWCGYYFRWKSSICLRW